MRIPRRLLALLLVFGLIAVACGGDDDDGTDTDDTTQDTGTDDAASDDGTDDASATDGAVTIEHAYGETVVEDVPERIVSIGAQWNGILLEMGAPVVGVLDDGLVEGGIYPWETDLMPDDVEVVPATDGVPHEQVAALEPDLIVVTFAVTDQASYDALAEIAPTIPALGDGQVDTWQDLTTVAGEFMRDPDGAQALIDEYDAQMDDLAAEFPSLDGKTYSFANYVPGDAIYVVTDPNDGSSKFFADLGMVIAPALLEAAGDLARTQLSLEQIELLEADLMLILTNGAETDDIVGFDQLEVVQSGAWQVADMALAVSMNTPNALSLKWALEQIRPALEAAAS